MFRNATFFYSLIFTYSNSLVIIYLWIICSFLHKTIIFKNDGFISFFPILIPSLHSCSCPSVPASSSKVIPSHCDDGGHACHCLVLNRTFSLHHYDVCWSFFQFLSNLSLLRTLTGNRCCVLSSTFLHRHNHWVCSFILLVWWVTRINWFFYISWFLV